MPLHLPPPLPIRFLPPLVFPSSLLLLLLKKKKKNEADVHQKQKPETPPICHHWKEEQRRRQQQEEKACPLQEMEPVLDAQPAMKPSWRCFSYEEIHQGTNGFDKDNLVGRVGYAEVCKGVTADGQVIAVKRLMRASTEEQREKDFLTELGTVGHVSTLLGCCVDRELHLVFEFSSRAAPSPPISMMRAHRRWRGSCIFPLLVFLLCCLKFSFRL